MIHNRDSRFSFCLLFFISGLILTVGCTMNTQEIPTSSSSNDPAAGTQAIQSVAEDTVPVFTRTVTPTTVAKIQETDIHTPVPVSEITAQPTQTATPLATATPIPSPTHTLEPSPTAVSVECQDTGTLPNQVFPVDVNVDTAHIAVNEEYLYLAVEQYIGIFDISEPESPEFLGFWQFPDMNDISDIVVDNGIVYIASGFTIEVLNASFQCLFKIIATIDMPFQVFLLESGNDKLYAGGGSESHGKEQVIIFSMLNPNQPEELSVVDLGQEPAIWSLFEDTLYSLSGDELTVTDVSDTGTHRPRPINLTLDSDVLRYTPAEFNKNTLFMLWGSDILTIVENLEGTTPIVISRDDTRYLMIDVFQVQDNYIFLGINSCDVECASGVLILDAENGQEISSVSLHPHYPVYDYQEIEENLFYAFSDNSLLVVNISNRDKPEIVNEVQFIQ